MRPTQILDVILVPNKTPEDAPVLRRRGLVRTYCVSEKTLTAEIAELRKVPMSILHVPKVVWLGGLGSSV